MPCCCQGLSFAPAVLEKGIQGRDGEVPRRLLLMMMDLSPTRQRRAKLARTRQGTEKKKRPASNGYTVVSGIAPGARLVERRSRVFCGRAIHGSDIQANHGSNTPPCAGWVLLRLGGGLHWHNGEYGFELASSR